MQKNAYCTKRNVYVLLCENRAIASKKRASLSHEHVHMFALQYNVPVQIESECLIVPCTQHTAYICVCFTEKILFTICNLQFCYLLTAWVPLNNIKYLFLCTHTAGL